METRRKASKRYKNAVSSKESSLKADNCIICFEEVSCRGKLGVCDHWFCFECIHEWSKVGRCAYIFDPLNYCVNTVHLLYLNDAVFSICLEHQHLSGLQEKVSMHFKGGK